MTWSGVLELWFDFSCPYAYLASRRARHLGVPIDWRPMLLGGVFRGIGAGQGPMATISPQKQAHNLADMQRWAARFGEVLRMPPAHPMRTVEALRTLLALPHSRWPAAIEGIYVAYWQRGEDITQPSVIAGALRTAGVPDEDIAAAQRRADEPAIKDELRRRTDEAIGLGIFGAPAWVVRRERGPVLVWGQDRIAWVEAILAGWDPDAGAPPGGARPLGPRRARPGATVDVYFDVASPFAYLALTQLSALAAAGATVRLVPILLGGLFRDIAQADVPLFEMPPPKRRYVEREMTWWARWWGVPFDMPAKFPQRTITAQRLCVLAAREGFAAGVALAAALGRAMWAEQRDLEDPATLREVLAAQQRPVSWIEATQDPEIKAALIANTASARERGVFGVPTFVVGNELYWGQDRLELVAAALAA